MSEYDLHQRPAPGAGGSSDRRSYGSWRVGGWSDAASPGPGGGWSDRTGLGPQVPTWQTHAALYGAVITGNYCCKFSSVITEANYMQAIASQPSRDTNGANDAYMKQTHFCIQVRGEWMARECRHSCNYACPTPTTDAGMTGGTQHVSSAERFPSACRHESRQRRRTGAARRHRGITLTARGERPKIVWVV